MKGRLFRQHGITQPWLKRIEWSFLLFNLTAFLLILLFKIIYFEKKICRASHVIGNFIGFPNVSRELIY